MLRRTFDPTKSHRYVRYGRMSDDEQNPRSPEQQFATVEQVRNRMGYPWVHVRDYRDDGVTGRLLRKRKGLQEMLEAIRTGMLAVDLILVDTYERFGRADELATIRADLYNTHGVLILTADSNFSDPTTVAGRALCFVEQIRSTEDSRVKAHNVLRGKRDLIRQHRAWPGGPAPLGLKLESVMTVGKNGQQEVNYKILVHDPETDWFVDRLFRKAKETRWGTSRLSKFFNADPGIPDNLKPFSPAKIGYILDNPIYYGELVWEEHCTGIINDTRVMERNAEEDVVRVPDCCRPIVSRELWDEVQGLRQKRRDQILRSRSRQADGKQLMPLAPGMTLKYLLTGLARCGHCGASLRPSLTKVTLKSGMVWRRLYYACPSHVGGSCCNGLYVPEDWLREVVIAQLRSRLLSTSAQARQVPDWFGPLVEEVRQEMQRRATEQPDQRLAWQHELTELQERVSGWFQSLANPRLDPLLRADIEAQYGNTRTRIVQLEGLIADDHAQLGNLENILETGRVVDRLQRLADILDDDDATRANLELCLHVDRIDCFADGKVRMRSCRLGAFAGLVELLRNPRAQEGAHRDPSFNSMGQIKPRRRARHRILIDPSQDNGLLREAEAATHPERFAGLEDRWFWQDEWEVPKVSSWAEQNAGAVAKLRATGKTVEELASCFGKTPPTIRKALKLAEAADPSLALPRKMPRPRWPEHHFQEVGALRRQGRSVAELSEHFGRSEPLIRAAVLLAEEADRREGGQPDAGETAPSS